MELFKTILFIVGIVAVFAFALWLTRYMEAKRREALTALARELGLTFRAGPDHDFDSLHSHAPFRVGRSRRAFNLLEGRTDIDGEPFAVTLGDYSYTERQGKQQVNRQFSFALFRPPYPAVPDLAIRREHLGDKVMSAIGFDDIDFESEEFSRRFHVKSPDKRFAYAVVDPRMMAYLLDDTPPEILLQGGQCLFTVSLQRRWEPSEFRAHFAWAREFFRRWPEHLRRELEERRPPGWSA